MSHFFAWMARMKFIQRWGLMHSTQTENIQEHSLRVAMIAHALAVIRNRLFAVISAPSARPWRPCTTTPARCSRGTCRVP